MRVVPQPDRRQVIKLGAPYDRGSMASNPQQHERLVEVVSALLYSFDPEGMGSTVSAPANEYDDPARLLVAQSIDSSDLRELVNHHYLASPEQLKSALIATLGLSRSVPLAFGLPSQSKSTDRGRSAADIRERTLARLNAVLRRPGMYGLDVDLSIGSLLADLGFATEREAALKEEGERLVARGGWSSRGVTGALIDIADVLVEERVCSIYAEICHRLGWLDHDAAISDGSYWEARNLGPGGVRAGEIGLEEELRGRFGDPSIRIGGNRGHVFGYVPASLSAPIVWFDASEGRVIACRIETEALGGDLTVGFAVAAPRHIPSVSAGRNAPLPFWARM